MGDEAEIVCAVPPNTTVLRFAVNKLPVPPHADIVEEFAFNVLVSPFNEPVVKVMSPLNVCVKDVPILSVPPEPFIVRAAPLTFPTKVAVPAVLVIETVFVVLKALKF